MSALIVVCILTFAGIYVARNIRVVAHDRANDGDVSIDVPGGHLDVHAHSMSGRVVPGIPLYPGARERKDSGGDAVVEWTSNRSGKEGSAGDRGFAVSASDMITDDPVDKVADFYRRQLPNWLVTHEGREVHMELHDGGYKRIIAIEAKHDGTHIGVASFGEPAAN